MAEAESKELAPETGSECGDSPGNEGRLRKMALILTQRRGSS